MPDNADLKIVITADTKGAEAGLNNVQNGLKKTAVSVGVANTATTDFNRTLQDLPYGIQGIGNNLQQLSISFADLKTKLGSSDAAIKAIGKSMIGPNGLAIAITLITTALTFAEVGLSRWIHKNKQAKEEADSWAKAQRSTVGDIAKQRLELDALVNIARSDVSTKKEQELALIRLNELIPDNIGHLTKQNIATAKGEEIINKYTQALINQAKAQMFAGRIAELAGKEFDARNEFMDKVQKRQKEFEQFLRTPAGASKAARAKAAFNAKKDFDALEKEYQKGYASLQAEVKKLEAEFNKNFQGGLPFFGKDDKKDKPDKERKFHPLRGAMDPLQANKDIRKFVEDEAAFLDAQLALVLGEIKPKPFKMIEVDDLKQTEAMKEGMRLFKMELQQQIDLLSGPAQNAWGAFIDGIADGETAIESLKNALGGLVKELIIAIGKMLIFEAIKKAIVVAAAATVPGAGAGAAVIGTISSLVNGVMAGGIGGQPAMVAVGRISGQDILLSVQRTERNNFING